MILLSSKRAEKALSEQKMDSWGKAKYIIVVAFLGLFSINGYFIGPRYQSEYHNGNFLLINLGLVIISEILFILITYYGIRKCFKTNELAGGGSFIERFVILAGPVMIKLIIIVIPISLVLMLTTYRIWHASRYGYSTFVTLAYPAFSYTFYHYLNRSFKRLGRLLREKEEKAREITDSLNRYRESIGQD